jgi:glucan phosphoethanolaminetransferase (alkaline phosphatase superfamily)
MNKKVPVNYLFFIFSFCFLAFIHTLHIFLIEPGFTFPKYFFLLYAFVQCVLEVLTFLSLFVWAQYYFPLRTQSFLLIAAYLFIISQIVDFFLVRLVDISVWYGISFVTQEGSGNFVELLKATNIPLSQWGLVASIGMGFIILCVLFYKVMNYFSIKKPLFFSRRFALSLSVASFFFLFVWDVIFSPFAFDTFSRQYLKALPWKTTFMPPKHEQLLLEGTLKYPWKDRDCFAGLDSRPFSLQRKPDIFLFITESLREDFISHEVTPHLADFRDQHIHFPKAMSNANATHISWFSYFYSLFPFHFSSYSSNQWEKGSVPLVALKKMGYDIHLYSASRLKFYNMDEMIFGKNRYLLDSENCYCMQEDIPPYEADYRTVDGLCREIAKEDRSGGRVFIIFLESTHFGYSWPEDEDVKFTPIDEKINYVEAAVSLRGIEKIKNRYRNALHYMDSLFGHFVQTLKKTSGWEESIIVFTGDHGEEFYEHGHLFHATELTKQQLHVPLYYKMGNMDMKDKVSADVVTSHMDVFPSILHYLIGEECFGSVLQGHSIFSPQKWPYVIGARYNAGRSPYEFFIHNGDQKLIAQFSNKNDIFHSKALNIIATKNDAEENIPFSLSIIHQHFGEALQTLFSP